MIKNSSAQSVNKFPRKNYFGFDFPTGQLVWELLEREWLAGPVFCKIFKVSPFPPLFLLLLKCWTYLTSFLQNIQGLAHKMKFFTWKKSLLSPQILTLKIERRQEARFDEIYSIIWVWRRSTQNSDSNNLPLAPLILNSWNV